MGSQFPSASGFPTPDFVSSDVLVSGSTKADFAHGLGTVPSMVRVLLVCNSAGDGYSTGDVIEAGICQGERGIATVGWSALIDATNVSIIQAGDIHNIVHKTAFTVAEFTKAKWDWRIEAWT